MDFVQAQLRLRLHVSVDLLGQFDSLFHTTSPPLIISSLGSLKVYIGSAIYTASIPGLEAKYGASLVVGTLGLSLYVFAYGLGPMVRFLSPLFNLGNT